jgi:hypothetical protein
MTSLKQILDWYQGLSPQSLADLPDYYHEQARFIDPFNDVAGHAAIGAIFQHMFEKTEQPRFHVQQSHQLGSDAWVRWRFSVTLMGRAIEIDGASQLELAEDGRILLHRDYWDASELFAQLPYIGVLMRKLKRQMQAQPAAHEPTNRG